MRQFAEFLKTNGCGVALKGVNNSSDGAHGFYVARCFLELQSLFIERLQQFQCGLKEQFLQFRCAFVREVTHEVTSICWYAVPVSR